VACWFNLAGYQKPADSESHLRPSALHPRIGPASPHRPANAHEDFIMSAGRMPNVTCWHEPVLSRVASIYDRAANNCLFFTNPLGTATVWRR